MRTKFPFTRLVWGLLRLAPITLLELTVPINTTEGLNNARERKHAKDNYIHLLGDLNSKGYSADLETIKIGSLGHYSTESFQSMYGILCHLTPRHISQLLLSLSRISISCSRTIINNLSGVPLPFYHCNVTLPVFFSFFILLYLPVFVIHSL